MKTLAPGRTLTASVDSRSITTSRFAGLLTSTSGEVWSVFVVEDGQARLRTVEIGERTPMTAEIKSGVEAHEKVIVHPANDITDGARVEPREHTSF